MNFVLFLLPALLPINLPAYLSPEHVPNILVMRRKKILYIANVVCVIINTFFSKYLYKISEDTLLSRLNVNVTLKREINQNYFTYFIYNFISVAFLIYAISCLYVPFYSQITRKFKI